MEINAILGAVLGAIVGAIVWAAIATTTGYEARFMAILVGCAIGLGAFLMEGRGAVSGIVCGLLAVVAILAGKVMVLNFVIEEGKAEFAAGDEAVMRQIYDETLADAGAFALLQSEEEYPQFMVDRGYTVAETAGDVFPSEVRQFIEEEVPVLIQFGSAPPDFNTWNMRSITTDQSFSEIYFSALGPIDVVFFAFGIGAAFRIGSGGEYE